MLSNLKQFLIKKTPVTLSLLVFVLLVALMLKLSSCRDVVLDDIDEAVSLDSIRVDSAMIPTVCSVACLNIKKMVNWLLLEN